MNNKNYIFIKVILEERLDWIWILIATYIYYQIITKGLDERVWRSKKRQKEKKYIKNWGI